MDVVISTCRAASSAQPACTSHVGLRDRDGVAGPSRYGSRARGGFSTSVPGLHHLAFHVDSVDEVERIRDQVSSHDRFPEAGRVPKVVRTGSPAGVGLQRATERAGWRWQSTKAP